MHRDSFLRWLVVLSSSAIFLAASLTVFSAATVGAPGVAHAQDDVVDEEVDEEQGPNRKSYLTWAFEALGIGYSLIFLALSFTLVALLVMNLLTARRENVVPIHLVEGFEQIPGDAFT